MAIDAESRLALALVPRVRDTESVEEVVGEVKDRTGGRVLGLMTGDDPAYETALWNAYGQEVATTARKRVRPAYSTAQGRLETRPSRFPERPRERTPSCRRPPGS